MIQYYFEGYIIIEKDADIDGSFAMYATEHDVLCNVYETVIEARIAYNALPAHIRQRYHIQPIKVIMEHKGDVLATEDQNA